MNFRAQITGNENLWREKGTWKKMNFWEQITGNENLWRTNVLGHKLQEMKFNEGKKEHEKII